MKAFRRICTRERHGQPRNSTRRDPDNPLSRRVTAACLALAIATAPLSVSWADPGYMVMQLQFELSGEPRFRQINMAYQQGIARSHWSYYGSSAKPGVVVPLYSINPREPGLFNQILFNRLDEPESEDQEKGKPGGIRALVSAVLGVGIIGAYAFATGKCMEDIADSVQNSAACDAVASGW